jgi:hypothetical protein
MRSLFPDLIVTVEEGEEDAYMAAGVPSERVIVHPPIVGLSGIRAWIHKEPAWTGRTVVVVDDDIRHVVALVGRKPRKIVEADAILRIIENTAQVASDLGASLFGWNLTPNPIKFKANDPLAFNQPVDQIYGLNPGPLTIDPKIKYAATYDLTMQGLLLERIVYSDQRFCFVSKVHTGTGGCQGVRTLEDRADATRRLQKKWGHWLRDTGKRGVESGYPAVPRKSQIASTK